MENSYIYKASGNWWLKYEDRVYGPFFTRTAAAKVLRGFIDHDDMQKARMQRKIRTKKVQPNVLQRILPVPIQSEKGSIKKKSKKERTSR